MLVTGPDIIFFWVARMIIAGLEFKPGKTERSKTTLPFRDVFFTGIIRDKQGRKMSKSLGNSPDPLDLIDKYGADGLRFGADANRAERTGHSFRRKADRGRTKLRHQALECGAVSANAWRRAPLTPKIDQASLSIYAVEVLARLNETIEALEDAYREYHFNAAAQTLYDFFWSDYCDWFVEAAKTDIFGEDPARKESALAVMDVVLSASLRLLHPFMPHITEELWALLGFGEGSIQFAKEPAAIPTPAADVRQTEIGQRHL